MKIPEDAGDRLVLGRNAISYKLRRAASIQVSRSTAAVPRSAGFCTASLTFMPSFVGAAVTKLTERVRCVYRQ